MCAEFGCTYYLFVHGVYERNICVCGEFMCVNVNLFERLISMCVHIIFVCIVSLYVRSMGVFILIFVCVHYLCLCLESVSVEYLCVVSLNVSNICCEYLYRYRCKLNSIILCCVYSINFYSITKWV